MKESAIYLLRKFSRLIRLNWTKKKTFAMSSTNSTNGKNDRDKVLLRLIHPMNGNSKEFVFSPHDSAADVAQHVFDNWPQEWDADRVNSPTILRLIYQGRFIHGNVTLAALQLPTGKVTVMHLMARETLPEPNSQGQRNRGKTEESNCCIML